MYLEKHGQLIYEAIRKGLSDADADARSHARRAFGLFRDHFPLLADTLLTSLDASKKKILLVGLQKSNSSSSSLLRLLGRNEQRIQYAFAGQCR